MYQKAALVWSIFVFICVSHVLLIDATLSPSNKNKKPKSGKDIKVKSGPQPDSVFDRNLVEEEPMARDIIVENAAYYKDTKNRLFNGTVLGYVTPWNNHGYDVAKIWGAKFDVISPVWLQIVRLSSGQYEMQGTHDIDASWVDDVRTAAKRKNKILPRILFDRFTDKDFSKLLTHEEEKQNVVRLIAETCQRYSFNGIVLEIWSQLAARVDDHHLIDLVKSIAQTLRNLHMDIIVVVPPVRKEMYDLFSRQHFEDLLPHITAFSLMTYDFSNLQRPGANAPLLWMRKAVNHICPETTTNLAEKRRKILLGMNLYGNDFTPEGGGAIVGHEFLDLVRHVKGRLRLDDTNVENFFEVKTPSGRHMVFYPTLHSISVRIELARELGTGISLWELGQGLDYFYDLF